MRDGGGDDVILCLRLQAILKKDFESFARLTMEDSNQFHAVCLDTYPPLVYMTDISHAIVDLIHEINRDYKETIVRFAFFLCMLPFRWRHYDTARERDSKSQLRKNTFFVAGGLYLRCGSKCMSLLEGGTCSISFGCD